jgi:hypothetical protein
MNRLFGWEILEDRRMMASLTQTDYFHTWAGGIIRSTDVAGVTYHPPSGHLYLSDSEIDELSQFVGHNIFETSLAGDRVFREIASNNNEPTGINYSSFDGFFYVTRDDRPQRGLLRYDDRLNTPLAYVDTSLAVPTATDPEDVTSDPTTGFLYVVDGSGGGRQVLVYDANLSFRYSFSVADRLADAEGIAFEPNLRHLFIVSGVEDDVLEYTVTGSFVARYDLNGFAPALRAPQGMTFAPTSDPTDHPSRLALYIVDGGQDNFPDGGVYEAVLSDPSNGTMSIRDNAGSDDAEEKSLRMSLTSSSLNLVEDKGVQTVGMRFNRINIPRGATISNAHIQFQTDKASNKSTSLVIQGEATDSSTTFLNANGNISSRPRTTASVTWNPPAWNTVGEAGPSQRTPNLSTIVQQIVNRPGWAADNSLALIVTGSGVRNAESFEGRAASAPQLHIDFVPPNTPVAAVAGPGPARLHVAIPEEVENDRLAFRYERRPDDERPGGKAARHHPLRFVDVPSVSRKSNSVPEGPHHGHSASVDATFAEWEQALTAIDW